MEVKLGFVHPWFPQGKFASFWSFYNQMNSQISADSNEQSNARRFIARLTIPAVVESDSNKRNLEELMRAMENLKAQIRSSTRTRCWCFNVDDRIFGRLDQSKHILGETFDGKHINLSGPDGNIIDCMFFPCTTKETIVIDESARLDGKT